MDNFLRAILLYILQCIFLFPLLQHNVIFINLRCHHLQKPLQQGHNSLPQSVEMSPCILKFHLNLQVKSIATKSKTEKITYELVMFGNFLFYCNLLVLFHLRLQLWFHKLYLAPGCSKQQLLKEKKNRPMINAF